MSSILRQSDLEKLYRDIESLGLKFPVASLAEALGFSRPTVSRYLSTGKPSTKFYNKFYEVFSGEIDKISSKISVPGESETVLKLLLSLKEIETELQSLKARLYAYASKVSIEKLEK